MNSATSIGLATANSPYDVSLFVLCETRLEFVDRNFRQVVRVIKWQPIISILEQQQQRIDVRRILLCL